jgi:hypothetical protein
LLEAGFLNRTGKIGICADVRLGCQTYPASVASSTGSNLEIPVEKFIAGENIKNYRKLLASPLDEAERLVVLSLLQGEESKLAKDEEFPKKADGLTPPVRTSASDEKPNDVLP